MAMRGVALVETLLALLAAGPFSLNEAVQVNQRSSGRQAAGQLERVFFAELGREGQIEGFEEHQHEPVPEDADFFLEFSSERGPAQVCTPPAEVVKRAESQGMTLMSANTTGAVFGVARDDDDEGNPEQDLDFLLWDCKHQKELMFLHLPKKAGAALEESMGKNNSQPHLAGASAAKRKLPDGEECSSWHVPGFLADAPNAFDTGRADTVCVVRDPWERIRGEYINALKSDPHDARVPGHVECSVTHFNQWVMRALETVEGGKPYAYDCGFVPQWSFVESPDGQRWCKEVIPVSKLSPRFNNLMATYGLSARIPAFKRNSKEKGRCNRLRARGVGDIFGARTQEMVRRVFKQDLEHFGDGLKGWKDVRAANGTLDAGDFGFGSL
jgi:hypothetical protein